jgi:putative ABC transport system substrate-binding protein
VSRSLALFALVLSTVCTIVSPSHAGDSAQIARVAVINPHSPATTPTGTSAFQERLRELGYIEGQNIMLDVRWADDQHDRLPGLVAAAVARKPDVIVTWGATTAIPASKATNTIPIVALGDLVGIGLAVSLARPGGNLTGVSLGYSNIPGKWLELLNETVPRLSTVAVIANPDNPINRSLTKELQTIASERHLKLRVFMVRDQEARNDAFEQAHRQAQAVVVLPDSVVNADLAGLTALAAKYRLPSIYSSRVAVDAGGLMSYGPNFAVAWQRAADYVDKILKGSKPGELPIEEPTQFELVVNLRTAKALKLTIPESVLLRANEVVR